MFMQQMAGVGNQYQVIDKYSLDASSGGDFTTPYTGAGLVDLKKVEVRRASERRQDDARHLARPESVAPERLG